MARSVFPFSRERQSSKNSGCAVGSPPEKVTPPPEALSRSMFFPSRWQSVAASYGVAQYRSNPCGQLRRLCSVRKSSPFSSFAWRKQAPQCRHPFCARTIRLVNACPSGLWHHSQRSGQPIRKTEVRMPGPSKTENSSIENTKPVFIRLECDECSRCGTWAKKRFLLCKIPPCRCSISFSFLN